MVRTKVFVGNLSFSTKENELAKEFEVAGKVISANIITRGPRSLGYGFVEMDNETDAQNAVKLLDKKEIDGRPINVEVAKPREEGADVAQSANAQGAARDNRRRGPRANRPTGDQQQQPRQPRQGGAPQNQGANSQGQQGGQRRRRSEDQDGQPRTSAPRRQQRPPRVEGEPDNRTPSTTTLFVANLPFSIEDDTFSKVLKDNNLTFKDAHVVKKRTGRSKGFGFIEFDTEADQQKALAALNNKEVDGRPLAVKVALTEIKSEDLAARSAATSSSPAPVKTSSPAPTKTSTTAPAKVSSPTPVKNSSPAPTKNSAPAQTNQEKK